MFRSFSLNHLTAGFVAVLVGYTSSVVIIFQAAASAGASEAQISSWMWALGVGMGVTSIGLSLYYRTPILTAWSTPGAALLVASLSGIPMGEAIGAFLFSALLITLCGLTGWFERVMHHIPMPFAAAMLAGILLRFGMDVFVAMQSDLSLVLLMFIGYLIARRLIPRYAVVSVLALGLVYTATQGDIQLGNVELRLAAPVFTMPEFSFASLIGVGVPLFVVTMTSQNIPGIAILRAHGYQTPLSPLIAWTGIASLILAPFGGYALNLAAITAAICMGREVDDDSRRRYLASVSAGALYFTVGLFGATLTALFAALPRELVLAIAGLALLGTISNSLNTALMNDSDREAALITFLVTASGLTLFSIGSAFWGLVAGVLARGILSGRLKNA